MTQILDMPRPGPDLVRQPPRNLPLGLLKELDHPQDIFRDLGPNWYASVMGTGIVAIAGAKLPVYVPRLHEFATAVWILAAAALVALTAAWAVRRPSMASPNLPPAPGCGCSKDSWAWR